MAKETDKPKHSSNKTAVDSGNKKKGFLAGFANLPDGTHRRKGNAKYHK